MIEKVVSIRRVTKVVKGGRILSFSVLVIVGDGEGNVGIGKGRAKETSVAVQKATRKARKNLVKMPMAKNSIAHRTVGKFGASVVLLMPTKIGRGVIASDCVRTVLSVAGISNVVAKCFGSTNPINVVYATLKALTSQSNVNNRWPNRRD